jgi:hypothetical protein
LVDLADHQKISKARGSKYSEDNKAIATSNKDALDENPHIFDISRAGNVSDGIIDILDNTDVAVWSKGITHEVNVPSDKVQEPSKIESTMTEYVESCNEKFGDRMGRNGLEEHLPIDVANKEDVDKIVGLGGCITDEANFVRRNGNKCKL